MAHHLLSSTLAKHVGVSNDYLRPIASSSLLRQKIIGIYHSHDGERGMRSIVVHRGAYIVNTITRSIAL